MTQKHPYLLIVLILTGCLLSANARFAAENPDFITWIPGVAAPPVIDGEIDELWNAEVPQAIEFVQSGTVEDAADLSAEWYGLHDADNLYFLIDVHDQFLESEAGSDIWRNDRIEVYFNMDNVKPGGNGHSGDNYQYAFHWNKPDEQFVNNSTWDGIAWAQTTTEYGYIIEVSIPWTTLTTLSAVEGWSFGMDIAINDNDGNVVYDSVTYWWCSTGGSEWGNIDGAGTIGLGPVFDGNYPPEIGEIELQTAEEGTSSSIELRATDRNEGDVLSFSVPDLPAFASLQDDGSGTAQLVIDAQAGDANIYELTAVVSDGTKEDSTDFILIVKDPAVASQVPVLDPVADGAVNQGSLLVVDLAATDLDSLTLAFAETDMPEFGRLIDNGDKTARVELNPGFDVIPGNYSVSLEVRDPDDNTDTLTFGVEVIQSVRLTEYHCDPVNGSMENNGSAESPWSSLEDVITAGKVFAAGDVIYLHDGYHGEATLDYDNADYVYIQPAEGASPTMARIAMSSNSSHWNVSGIEISRSLAPEFSKATMISMSGSYNVISDCVVYTYADASAWELDDWLTIPSNGMYVGGHHNLAENCSFKNVALGVNVGGDDCTIRGCSVQNFTVDGMRGLGDDLLFEYNYIADNYNVDDNHDDGFQSWSTGPEGNVGAGVVYRITLRGNVIIETTDPDRPFQGSLQGIGCFDGMFQDWVVENNVVLVNQWHGIALYGAINCSIINNTVLDQDMFLDPGPTWITIRAHKNYSSATTDEDRAYYAGRDNVVKNNLTTRMSVNDSVGTVENNIELSYAQFGKYFVAYPDDLHLRSGSPAIDSGDASVAPELDADGNPRAMDGDWDGVAVLDLGAYELATPMDWIHHPELGWLYTGYATDPANMWLYSSYLNGWAWSSQDLFPVLYDLNNSRYVYYMIFDDVGVWFFDYTTWNWTLNP